MISNIPYSHQKDRWIVVTLLPVAILCGYYWRIHNPIAYPTAKPIRLLGTACASVAVETPINLGHLEPKGRINPDGSEVWGYPEGSGLEEVIEVHVKDGRVVREVLRPSSASAENLVAGVLSGEEGEDSSHLSGGR